MMISEEERWHKANLLRFSLSFLLVFTSYTAIQNLETSVSADSATCSGCLGETVGNCFDPVTSQCTEATFLMCDDACPGQSFNKSSYVGTTTSKWIKCESKVGSVSLGILYFFCMAFSLGGSVIPNYVDTVSTMRFGMIGYCFFCLFNTIAALFPTSESMQYVLLVPSAVITGISAAFVWAAQGAYLTESAVAYSSASTSTSIALAMGQYNGFFWGIYQTSQVFGNLISALMLQFVSAAFLFMFYLLICIIGTVVMWRSVLSIKILVRGSKNPDHHCIETQPLLTAKTSKNHHLSVKESISEVVAMATDSRMAGLLPLVLFNGMEQGFAWGDYTSHFLKISIGQASIGYVMTLYGTFNAIGAYSSGKLLSRKALSAWSLFIFAAVVMKLSYIILWIAHGSLSFCDPSWTLFIITGSLLGLGDGIFSTVICVVIGDVVPTHPIPAFAIMKFFQTAAVSACFFYNDFFPTSIRLLLLITTLNVGMLCFYKSTTKQLLN